MIQRLVCLVAALSFLSATNARAELPSFVDVPGAAGTFEWDVFVSPGAGPHNPDVQQLGGTSQITAASANPPGTGPFVTGTSNLYSGVLTAGTTTVTASVTPSQIGGPLTTFAFQLGFDSAGNQPTAGSFLLNGATAPTDFLYRGVGADGSHYYWAEFVGVATAPNATLQYSAGPHVILRGAKADYINGTAAVNISDPALVPEPAAGLLATVLALVPLATRRRKS